MKIFDYEDRLNTLAKLIGEGKTGTPAELAKRINICESRLFRIIEELKLMGVPIEYCRKRCSYYYTIPYKFHISCEIRPLTDDEINNTYGGSFLSTAFFVEWADRTLYL